MLRAALPGALVGTPLGILFVAPLASDLFIKLLFAAMWCSFGLLHLRRINEITSYEGMTPHDKSFDHKVGFIVGFALQDSLSNFAAGLMILFYQPFDTGDLVEAGGATIASDLDTAQLVQVFDHQGLGAGPCGPDAGRCAGRAASDDDDVPTITNHGTPRHLLPIPTPRGSPRPRGGRRHRMARRGAGARHRFV